MTRVRERLGLAIVVFTCYSGAAIGVTNAYPFSTFPMYSEDAPNFGARLVVKDQAGERREIERYESWTCAADLSFDDLEQTICPDGRTGQPTGYLVKEALDHIRDNPAAPHAVAEPVELIVRTWRLEGDQIRELDCPVAKCTAQLD
ncbi:hypothetical protein [Enhygromyxa salina]|nr:hypothetical protein [Enhygromyxa salina]